MKGEITLKILEFIGDFAANAVDVAGAFLESPYGSSSSQLQCVLHRRQTERQKKEIENMEKQKYYNLIYKLKKDGLIEEIIKNQKRILAITDKGRKKLPILKNRFQRNLPKTRYKRKNGDKFIIFIFDIPEKDRIKRRWLREALKNLGLKMVQKSVWLGKVKMPQDFLDDLYKLKLTDFVEIFEISKQGSLKNIL